MEDSFYKNYYECCHKCSEQINQCVTEINALDTPTIRESELTLKDYSFAMLLGIIGALITSSKSAESLLDKIHQIASESSKSSDDVFKKVTKFLLGHQGDYIDSVPVLDGEQVARKFVTRHAQEVGDAYIMNGLRSGPHRIFWGHDIFSLSKDNPFIIMQKQIPGVKGIVQTLKHLTADTFSKQGLPIPTSSWWDYSYTNERGVKKVGNKLLDVCNNFYDMSKSKDRISVTGANNDIFNHVFSVHIQDFGAQQLGKILCERYLRYIKIDNPSMQHQFKLIFAVSLFYFNCLIGAIKYAIPYINWCAAVMMFKEYGLMMLESNRETRQLQTVTDNLLKEADELEKRVEFSSYYINRIVQGGK